MAKKKLTDKNGEVLELTREDIAEMTPFKDAFPNLYDSWESGKS
jgi:hypothetical protein